LRIGIASHIVIDTIMSADGRVTESIGGPPCYCGITRGYGTTRFLSSETFRNGQPSAVALDLIALMDALKIQKATLAG